MNRQRQTPRTPEALLSRTGLARRAPSRPGFTLIELVVAMALGAIVVTSTFAIFGMIDRADKLQSRRLDRAQELAIAHLVMSRAFTTLLMSDEQVPADDKLQERILEDAASAAEDRVDMPEPTGKEFRFALQPSRSARLPSGGAAQELDVTLRTPPIIGGLREAGDDQTGLTADQIETLQRQIEAGGAPGQARRGPATGPSSRLLVGLLDADASDALSTRLLSETSRLAARDDGNGLSDPTPGGKLPARAPGLRGRFELRAATPPPAPAEGAAIVAPPEDGLELWWMQYPPGSGPQGETLESETDGDEVPDASGDAAVSDRDADGGNINERLAQARQAAAPAREIRLISGLTSARWQVYRQKKFVSKMRATFDRELPAYVEFEFTTTDGRDEKWAFEVAWTSGQEPGALLRSNQAPLAADALGAGEGGGESVLLGPDGKPITGTDGQPLKVTVGPDGKPVTNSANPNIKVSIGADGRPQVSVNGQPATVGPKTGGGSGSTTSGGGPNDFTREQIMEMVNRRLREMQGGGG